MTASGTGSMALGSADGTQNGPQATAGRSIAIGSADSATNRAGPVASAADSIAIGTGSSATFAASVAIGAGAQTTASYQIVLGTAAHTVFVPGNMTMGAPGASTLNMNENKITNLADGTAPGDAVNLRQLRETRKLLAGGVASAVAMSNIPLVDPNKTFAVGVGLGGFDGQSSVAFGASYRLSPSTMIRGSVSGGTASKAAVGVGLGRSW